MSMVLTMISHESPKLEPAWMSVPLDPLFQKIKFTKIIIYLIYLASDKTSKSISISIGSPSHQELLVIPPLGFDFNL